MSFSGPQARASISRPIRQNSFPPGPSQSTNSFISSALSELFIHSEVLPEFISRVQQLLPMIPDQFHALLNVDLLSLYLLTIFPSNSQLLNLLRIHYSRTIAFFSDLNADSNNLLQRATHALLSFVLSFLSSIPPNSLSRKDAIVIFTSSQLFSVIQRIPLEFVIEIIKNIQSSVSENELPSIYSLICSKKTPYLPKYSHKAYTLVLDLDETLGHYHKEKFLARPGAEVFLIEMSKIFEVVLYTASGEEYANNAMKAVDTQGLVLLRLYSEHIIGEHWKDLDCLGRDVDKVIIVDNFKKAFEKHWRNGIEISPWVGDESDQELFRLMAILREIPRVQGKNIYEMLEIVKTSLKKEE